MAPACSIYYIGVHRPFQSNWNRNPHKSNLGLDCWDCLLDTHGKFDLFVLGSDNEKKEKGQLSEFVFCRIKSIHAVD